MTQKPDEVSIAECEAYPHGVNGEPFSQLDKNGSQMLREALERLKRANTEAEELKALLRWCVEQLRDPESLWHHTDCAEKARIEEILK